MTASRYDCRGPRRHTGHVLHDEPLWPKLSQRTQELGDPVAGIVGCQAFAADGKWLARRPTCHKSEAPPHRLEVDSRDVRLEDLGLGMVRPVGRARIWHRLDCCRRDEAGGFETEGQTSGAGEEVDGFERPDKTDSGAGSPVLQ